MPASFLLPVLILFSAVARGARVGEATGGAGQVHEHSTVRERALREQRGVDPCEEVDSARFARCPSRHGCHSDYPGAGHQQQEQWPDLQLFVRTTAHFEAQMRYFLLRSLVLFWPLEHLRLVVVLDAEKPADVAWKSTLEEQLAATGMARSEVFLEPPNGLYEGGHSRQQWSQFWADNYTASAYVGFVDTDTFFTTVVHPRALFTLGRPIVIGMAGARTSIFWWKAAQTTEAVLQKPEVMNAMNYFPVIIKTSHLAELRAHITALSGEEHFDAAFAKFSRTHDLAKTFDYAEKLANETYSQFSIMANYVFYHKPCEYTFSFEEVVQGWRDYHEHDAVTNCLDSIFDEWNTFPRVRVAEHWEHGTFPMRPADESRHLIEGYCRSGGDADVGCHAFHPHKLQASLFRFEEHTWYWDPMCHVAQARHYKAVKEYGHTWPADVLDLLLGDFPNISSVEADKHYAMLAPTGLQEV